MAVMMADPKELKIPISEAYTAGREAYERGDSYPYQTNPYGHDRFAERLDYFIGYEDASQGVSVEFRALAEENGERY